MNSLVSNSRNILKNNGYKNDYSRREKHNIFETGHAHLLNKHMTRMFLLILVLITALCISRYSEAGDAKTDSSTKYPNTPEGVVEAFIKADFDGSANEVIGEIKKRMQYVNWEAYPGADCSSVARKYEITKRTEEAISANVEVKFYVLGNLCGYDSYTATNKEETIIFGLIKTDSRWKIDYPDPSPIISPLTALNLVKYELSKPYLKDKKNKQTQTLRKKIEVTQEKLSKLCNALKLKEN